MLNFRMADRVVLLTVVTVAFASADACASYGIFIGKTSRPMVVRFWRAEALRGLRRGDALAASIEARTKVLFGIRPPD